MLKVTSRPIFVSRCINVLLCRLYLDIPKLTQHSNGKNVCNERCTCVNTTSHDVPLTRRSFNELRLINFNRMENKIETMSYKHRRSCCIHIVTLTQNLRDVDVYIYRYNVLCCVEILKNLPVHSFNALIIPILRDCLPNYF